MQRNQNEQSKSPQQGLKSHKNITSSVAFHLKTQNDRGGQQEQHKSPDVNKPELRNTWRKAQMPYNKLPEVFNQQKQKKKYGNKVTQDMIQNLGKLIENSQYKQTQKYLQPLKPKQEKKQKGERNLFKPLQKMRDMVNKAHQQIKLGQEIPTVKSGPKISQCISLQVIKRGHNTGIIKKMLHIPTMTLACVRQQPCTQKDSRNFIRDWTKLWKQKLSSQSKNFVQIHEVLYNYPEGAISVSFELVRFDDYFTIVVLKIIESFYRITQVHFGGISPSQIMFTQQNKIKLSLGLFYHIPIPQSFSIYHIKATQKTNLFDFNNTITKFMKNPIEKSPNIQIQRSIDIFKLGLIALNCAIGNFENFQQYSSIFNAIRYVFSEQGQKQVDLDNACCLLHSQQYLIQIVSTNSQGDKNQKKTEQKFVNYMKLLKNRYSIHFINFLCQCLKLNHNKRANLDQLLNHTFITTSHDNDNKTVKIQLSDMLALGRNWNKSMFQSQKLHKIDSFMALLRPVLQYCTRQALIELLNVHKDKIYQVGKCVGINCQKLGKRIQQLIIQLIRK